MIDLKFTNVSKRYRVRQQQQQNGSDSSSSLGVLAPIMRRLQQLGGGKKEEFWAVKDVTLMVERGEALGIIGHNGAGKSTILKLLSNITTPTTGEIEIRGRLAALIEVGSGFHPELTGRENVYLSGAILGMSRREITAKLASIVEFAGVGQFLDVPVKRYSSGMYVRLGFAIAAHLEPDILLLDEVLAVGDAAFQAKCLQRIRELKEAGTTIVFISHDLVAVEGLCDRVILLERGQVKLSGSPHLVITEYQRQATSFVPSTPPSAPDVSISKKAEITSLAFYDSAGREANAFSTGSPIVASVNFKVHEHAEDVAFELFFYGGNGELQCQLTTALSGERIDLEPGSGTIEFSCAELGLQPDVYYLDATIIHRNSDKGLDWQYRCAMLPVNHGKTVRGNFYMPHEWQITQKRAADIQSNITPSLKEFVS